jgi:hypothetical protein
MEHGGSVSSLLLELKKNRGSGSKADSIRLRYGSMQKLVLVPEN